METMSQAIVDGRQLKSRPQINENHKRNLSQNSLLWCLLGEIAAQLEWPCNGRMQRLSPEDWKDILSSGLHREQRIAQGIDGGFVLLGQRTSKMTKQQFVELIEFIRWFGAERGIKFKADESYGEYPEMNK